MARPPDAHGPAAGPGRPEETPVRAKAERTSARSSRRRSGSPLERLRAVWMALPRERRLAGGAALALVFTLFLPWYQETVIARSTTANLSTISASLTGWGAFSFVEAAVLLVAAAVLLLLFVRAEGAAFHVPGGDGGVITAAGLWTCLLIVWRMFDKQGTTGHGLYTTASGIEWGIFIALGVAALLAYSGSRIKLANEPEPPLPGEVAPPDSASPGRAPAAPASRRAAAPPAPAPAPPQRRRVRPSSLAEPEAPYPSPPIDDATQVMSGPSGDEPRPGDREPRPHRGLDLSELDQIKLDEPPEVPTIRRREPDPEDPLTARRDRPD